MALKPLVSVVVAVLMLRQMETIRAKMGREQMEIFSELHREM
jgi:hypothetical protein